MYRYYQRKLIYGIECDVTFAHPALLQRKGLPYLKLELITTKGILMQNHRVYKNGNSWVMTLSAHQLNHIKVMPGQYVRVEMKRGHFLRLSKATPKIQEALTPRH